MDDIKLNYDNKLALYKEVIEERLGEDLKGKTMPYTSINGHMYSILDKSGNLGGRLSTEDFDSSIKKYKTENFVSYGKTMKGYVLVPDVVLKDKAEIILLLKKSLAYTSTLKPK